MQTSIPARNCILDSNTVARSIRRMAFQIAEDNSEEGRIVIAGIVGNGMVLAKKITAALREILPVEVSLMDIEINKRAPVNASITTYEDLTGKVVIVVDDVSNTGKTLLYALKPFLDYEPKKIQTLVLVERSHKIFAVQPDYVGLSLATTLQEHISVEVEGSEITGAWLH